MPKFVITYEMKITAVKTEEIEAESLAAAYQHADQAVEKMQDENHPLDGFVADHDLTTLPICASITDEADVHHVFSEIPLDLAVDAANRALHGTDATPQEEADDNTWEDVMDTAEELVQKDIELFGPDTHPRN